MCGEGTARKLAGRTITVKLQLFTVSTRQPAASSVFHPCYAFISQLFCHLPITPNPLLAMRCGSCHVLQPQQCCRRSMQMELALNDKKCHSRAAWHVVSFVTTLQHTHPATVKPRLSSPLLEGTRPACT